MTGIKNLNRDPDMYDTIWCAIIIVFCLKSVNQSLWGTELFPGGKTLKRKKK